MKNPLFWGTSVGTIVVCVLLLYGNKYHNLDLSIWLSVLGTVITAIAFGFGTYFVALAVDAYSQLGSVRETSEMVRKASHEVLSTRTALTELSEEVRGTARKMEHEAFAHIELLIAAMAEYAQQLPRASEAQKRAAKQLITGAACVRARFTCALSNETDAVNSAALLLANYKDQSALGVLAKAKIRFRDNREVCAALDHAITIIEMPVNE